MQTNQPPAGSSDIVTERNRYFTGKYMTARDFLAEQAYFLDRHRLHNRLLHGWGIVCGLDVVEHDRDPACTHDWIIIKAGIALDSYGRELIVPRDMPVKIPEPEEIVSTDAKADPDAEDSPPPTEFLVCLRYQEQPIELVPALYAADGVNATHQEANRVRETVCVEFKPLDDVSEDCWLSSTNGHETRCHDDCDEGKTGSGGTCLTPDDPCGGTVPLAVIRYAGIEADEGVAIQDTLGRREILGKGSVLTQIVDINWPHGEIISLADLSDRLRCGDEDDQTYRFTVRFDRKLLLREAGKTDYGINEHTFTVQYLNDTDQDFLEVIDVGVDPDDEALAYFVVRDIYLRKRAGSIDNSKVLITLKCDFILDCHGDPVDGNHLRGRLPTGNGTPGGTFESWFDVRDE